MSLHRKVYQQLYQNGYMDFAAGRRANVNVALPIAGLTNSQDQSHLLEAGHFSCGLIWDTEAKDYRAVAKVATSVLGR